MTYLLIFGVGAIVIYFIINRKLYHIPNNTITAVTGAPGTGKSLLCTRLAYKSYKKAYRNWKICKIIKRKKYKDVEAPLLVSTIPILISSIYAKKRKWSEPLTLEYLTCEKYFPEKSVIYIGEIGIIAGQWEYDNPKVIEGLGWLFRFYRHTTDGRIYLDDQSVGSIVKPVRARLGVVQNLIKRIKVPILPIMLLQTVPRLMVDAEDAVVPEKEDIVTRRQKWIAVYCPSRKKARYQSRAYKPLRDKKAISTIKAWDTNNGYTRYLPNLRSTEDEKKIYKKSSIFMSHYETEPE